MVEKPMHLDGNAAPRFAWMGRVAQPSFGPPLHDHDIWELVYYTSGSGIVRVGETEHPISQGTLLCLPPHVPHVQVCTEGYTNYFLGISGDLGATLDGSQVPTIYEGADGSLLPLLAAMHRESCQREVGWQAVVDALFASLLIILRRRCATKIFPAVERLKHMLCDRMQDPNLRIGQTLTKAGTVGDRCLWGGPSRRTDRVQRPISFQPSLPPIDWQASEPLSAPGHSKIVGLLLLLCGLTLGKQRFDESDRAPIRHYRTGWPSRSFARCGSRVRLFAGS